MIISSMYQEPIIWISKKAMDKMRAYVDISDKEIGWLVLVDKISFCEYEIIDCILPHQEVNAVTCELSPGALQDISYELLSQGRDEDYMKIKGWCHSHVNMGINPSYQDDKQMYDFEEGNDWFIRGILNKKGEMKFDIFDFKHELIYEDVEAKQTIEDNEYFNVQREIQEKITVKKEIVKAPTVSKQFSKKDNLYTDLLDAESWDEYYEKMYKNYYSEDYLREEF